MKFSKKPKILVIVGPTASGKTTLAIRLAKKLNGEIISADSRQVYKGLDLGTGKVTKKESRGIPHHLLDVKSPKTNFSVADFQKEANRTIRKIIENGRLPIICGGTGFYIQSIVDGIILPDVPPNKILRKQLEQKNNDELKNILEGIDPKRAARIDVKNRRRIIRAIEIAKSLGAVPSIVRKPEYQALQFGIDISKEKLAENIRVRLHSRIKAGMIAEAEQLHKKGLSFRRMNALGLEYRFLAFYLQRKITREQLIEQLDSAIRNYAKRQMTWFKRDKRIIWGSAEMIEDAAVRFFNK